MVSNYSTILAERSSSRWLTKDIDSVGLSHSVRRCLPASVHCEVVCRYESLVIKRILRLLRSHLSLPVKRITVSFIRVHVHRCVVAEGRREGLLPKKKKRKEQRGNRNKEEEKEFGTTFGTLWVQEKSNLRHLIKRSPGTTVAPLRASIPRVLPRRTFIPAETCPQLTLLA